MSGPTYPWRIVTVTLLLLAAMQFVRPVLKSPPHQPLMEGAALPASVSGILQRACQDCHSNNTHWPWYARIAPLSLVIADDVNKGRAFLNLSEWDRYSRGQKLGYLAGMAQATRNRKMPPRIYSALHPTSRLTEAERNLIAGWANDERTRLRYR